MKTKLFPHIAAVLAIAFTVTIASAQDNSTPPATTSDLETIYTTAIESRTAEILALLKLTNAEQSARVHDAIITQYRLLKARDIFIDAMLKAEGKELNYSNRAGKIHYESKPVHDQFLAKLSADLTPEQVEAVKDKMTYMKVKVTYDAYCEIVPGLDDAAKAIILKTLKAAREEAIDGGSAHEKSDIFQKHKDQINDYLNAHGYDTAKAFKDWEAKQLAKSSDAGTPKTEPTTK